MPEYMNESYWNDLYSDEPSDPKHPANYTPFLPTSEEKRFMINPHLTPMKKSKFAIFIPDIGYRVEKNLKGNYSNNAWKCLTLKCLCPYFNGTFFYNGWKNFFY